MKNKFFDENYWQTATPESVKKEIEQGADVNEKDKVGKTPLLMASIHNYNPDVIITLVENGADVNARDISGMTPLMWAYTFDTDNTAVINALIECGAE